MIDGKLQLVRKVVSLLAKGDYGELARMTDERRLDAAGIERAIVEYGRTLTEIPHDALSRINCISVNGSLPAQWSVRSPLWTVEEGMSDLSIELTLTDAGNGEYRVDLDDIHVL